jgi:hypothetical protein
MSRTACLPTAAAIVCLLLPAGTAYAAKEKFVRTKPHVNVGTLNQVGASEIASLTLRPVDLSPAGAADTICVLQGTVQVSVPAASRASGSGDEVVDAADFQVWRLHRVLVREGQLLQIPLDLPPDDSSRYPLPRAFLVEILTDPVPPGLSSPHCDVEWLVQVSDPGAGTTGTVSTSYRPQFHLRRMDVSMP